MSILSSCVYAHFVYMPHWFPGRLAEVIEGSINTVNDIFESHVVIGTWNRITCRMSKCLKR